MADVTPEDTPAIRAHLQRRHLYGPDRFRRAIEAQLGRTVGPRKIGRPCKSPPAPGAIADREVDSDPIFGPIFPGERTLQGSFVKVVTIHLWDPDSLRRDANFMVHHEAGKHDAVYQHDPFD